MLVTPKRNGEVSVDQVGAVQEPPALGESDFLQKDPLAL